MKKLLFKLFLLGFIVLSVSCGVVGHKGTQTSYLKSIPKKQNSYYYFMMSQLMNRPETVDESEAYLDQALKKDKESAYLWSQKAIAVARRSQWDEALEFAEKSIAKDPDNTDTIVLLGKLYAAKKDPSAAIHYYRRALALNKRLEEVYTVMAREYLSLNNKAQAISSLQGCLSEISDAMSCRYYLATIYLEGKQYTQALKYFESLQLLEPENPKILQTIGEIYLEQKKYEQALDIFSQLKKLYPQDVTYYIRAGLTYYELKRIDDAIAEFLGVADRFPKSDRVNYFLGLLFMEKNENEKAFKYLDRVDSSSPLFKEALSRLLYLLREKNDVVGAVNLIDKKVNRKEQTAEFYYLKVSLLVHGGEYGRALLETNEAMVRFGTEEQLLFQRAIILDRLGKWEDSKKDLIEIVTANPEADGAFNYLGYSMLENGDDIELAEKYILKAAALKPGDGHVTDSLGWLYYKKEDYNRALQYLLKANSQRPDEAAILEHLGDVYFTIKNKKRARYYYEKALMLLEKIQNKSPEEQKIMSSVKDKLGKF